MNASRASADPEGKKTRPNAAAGLRTLVRRWWAPLSAALLVGVLYWLRQDDVFYLLHGQESQGLLLARALAEGHGFVDLSLPGHPAHVREPPLFYVGLAGVIRFFGFRLYPLKLVMWLSYVGAAGLGTLYFQRRSRPLPAFASMVLAFSSYELFRFFSGPKSDIPFIAVIFGALLLLDAWRTEFLQGETEEDGQTWAGRRRQWRFASAGAAAVIAAVFLRTLGAALFLGLAAAVWFESREKIVRRLRLKWLAFFAVPLLLAMGLWTWRSGHTANPAGYNYLDWFLMDLAPDSPAMIAVDYHAPLMGPLPRVGSPEFLARLRRNLLRYPQICMSQLFGLALPPPHSKAAGILAPLTALFVLALAAAGAYFAERPHSRLPLFFLFFYLAAVAAWPMDDKRLMYPVLPFLAYYLVWAADQVLERATVIVENKIRKGAPPAGRQWSQPVSSLLLILLVGPPIALHLRTDLQYAAFVKTLPTVEFQPGFRIRFASREIMASYRVLAWTRENIPAEAVLMFHSPPPCRLISGHVCRPIPFNEDLTKVRDYLVDGGADYLVLDEWGRSFPGGPGQFTETVLRPLVSRYAGDFETVFQVPGTAAAVVKVRRR